MRKDRRTRRNRRRGGAATVMPLEYYNPGAAEPSAGAGRDLLKAIPPIGVRPRIGGSRKMKKGGFVPSIMNSFAISASKYAVPVALFAGYKLLTRKRKGNRHYTRRR
jgi:hypothetical protein